MANTFRPNMKRWNCADVRANKMNVGQSGKKIEVELSKTDHR